MDFVALLLLAAAAFLARWRNFFRLVDFRVPLFYARFRCFRHRRVVYDAARLLEKRVRPSLLQVLFHRADAKGLGEGTPAQGD